MSNMNSHNGPDFSHDNRVLGRFYGTDDSPTVVIFAGIHGNEKAGVYAAKRVVQKIMDTNLKFKGNVHLILGNINALNKGIRFDQIDLNRIWRNENIQDLKLSETAVNGELKEQRDIFAIISELLIEAHGPFYFLDLHTTSAASVPFITISDSLNNRKFSSNFQVPIVLGIEEYLDGPLLTYINEFGHIALGFEGGAHDAPSSIVNCEAFIWKALVHSKCIDKSEVSDFQQYQKVFTDLGCKYEFFAIKFRYELHENQKFTMLSGFENFEPVKKNEILAKSNGELIKAPRKGRIFMPLYQKLGEDGFFILRRVSKFWINASVIARRLKINHILRLIPGINKDPDNNYTLIVNPKVARFMTVQIFHLFGYRQQIYKDDKLHFIKRDRKVSKFI